MSQEIQTALYFSRLATSFCYASTKDVDSVFKCISPVPIAPSEYAVRLGSFLHCSEGAFVAASVYAQRLFEFNPALFCDRSIHKIMAACAVIGAKFVDDRFFSNTYYAECAGVPLPEMNLLEVSLLKMLNFGVFVSEDDFKKMRHRLDNTTQVASFSLFQNFPTSTAKNVTKSAPWTQVHPKASSFLSRVV